MDISFFKTADGLDMIEFAASSPEERQQYAGALCLDLPEGMYRDVRMSFREVRETGGKTRKVPTILLGPAKVGERLQLPGDAEKAEPQAPIPAAIDIPKVVTDADDARLELMAAKNGVEVTDGWRNKNRAFRNASVAKAMHTTNKR